MMCRTTRCQRQYAKKSACDTRPNSHVDPVTVEHARRSSFSLNDKPCVTAQAPTTSERNTASLQVSTQRQGRTAIDTTLSLTCKRYVAHCICSRCSELHPRFDQKLVTHQDFCMLLTANPASAARPDGHCRKPRLDRNDSASKVART